ncbi:MAG: hypothetical protein E7361_00200 [Clostridiales bacterium]|nr:hypothetical protein [Clostridiales bacterium]
MGREDVTKIANELVKTREQYNIASEAEQQSLLTKGEELDNQLGENLSKLSIADQFELMHDLYDPTNVHMSKPAVEYAPVMKKVIENISTNFLDNPRNLNFLDPCFLTTEVVEQMSMDQLILLENYISNGKVAHVGSRGAILASQEKQKEMLGVIGKEIQSLQKDVMDSGVLGDRTKLSPEILNENSREI